MKWVAPWRNRGFVLSFPGVVMQFQAGEKACSSSAEFVLLQLAVLFYRLGTQAK